MSFPAILRRFSLHRRPHLPPSVETALESIDQISEILTPPERSRLLALAGQAGESIEEYIKLFRAAAIFHVLKFRGPKDHAIAQLFMPFYRRHFDRAAPVDVIMPAETLQSHAESIIINAPGGAAFEALVQSNAEAAAILNHAIDLPILLNRLGSYFADAYGRLELPTEDNFDERAYLAGNPDVAADVARGEIRSGKTHFLEFGKTEGRLQRRYCVEDDLCRHIVYPLEIKRSSVSAFPIGEMIDCQIAKLESLLERPISAAPVVSVLASDEYDAGSAILEDSPIGEAYSSLRWRSTLYLASFRDAIVDVDNGIVGFGENRLWGDSIANTLKSPRGLARSPDMFLLNGRYGRLEVQEPSFIADGPAMLAQHWACPTNYGHWMMNTLFSIFLMRKELSAGKLKLLFPVLSDGERQQILRMGAPPTSIVEIDRRYAHCPRLLYPSPLTTSGNLTPHATINAFFGFLRQRFLPAEKLERPSLVYITRLGYRPEGRCVTRRMTNERELIEALRPLGFAVMAPHDLDFASQIHMLSNARIVIGQFGAALWNASFAPKGSWLIEIATGNWVSNEYLYAAHLAGRRFSRIAIEPMAIETSPDDPDDFDFVAPIERILSIVRDGLKRTEVVVTRGLKS